MMEILHAPCENSKEKCPLPQRSGKMPSCHCHHYTALCAAGTVVPGAWKREKEKHPGYFLCSLQPLQVPFAAPWARKKKFLELLYLHLLCTSGFQAAFESRLGNTGRGKR